MKKRDLELRLQKLGWWYLRQGGNHEIWTNGQISQPLPRHAEIVETTAKKIIRRAELNPPGNKE